MALSSSRVGRALGDCAMSPPLQRRPRSGSGFAWQMGMACVAAAVGTVLVMSLGRESAGPAERSVPSARIADAASSLASRKSLDTLTAREAASGNAGPAVDATASILAARLDPRPDMPPVALAPDPAPRAQEIAAERPADDRPKSGKAAASGTLAAIDIRPAPSRRPSFAAAPALAASAGEPPAVEPVALTRSPPVIEDNDALVRTSAATPTACLPPALRQALRDAASRFGAITLLSTTSLHGHNHADGSARAKMHLACQAVDFRPPSGKLKQVVAFLKGRPGLGGVEGYRDDVIHIDAAQGQTMARRAPSRKTTPILEEGDTSAE